jgi:hypothetical protein
MKAKIIGYLLLIFLEALGFSVLSTKALAVDLKLMTGPQGGSWYPLGGAIAELLQKAIPGVNVSVLPGGGITNIKAVEEGKVQIALSNFVSAVDAVEGREPFNKKAEKVRNMLFLYPQYFQVAVLEDSGIQTPADLKGKAIAPGIKGHTGEQFARHLLQVYGLSYGDMSKVQYVSYADAVNLMKDGHLHAFLALTTVPASAIIDLSTDRKIRLLSLTEDKLHELQAINSGYIKRVIPKGTYQSVEYDVTTFGTFTHLIVTSDLPEDLVYQMTKVLVENVTTLGEVVRDVQGITPKDMATDSGVVPYHPGALKYFKEIGVK